MTESRNVFQKKFGHRQKKHGKTLCEDGSWCQLAQKLRIGKKCLGVFFEMRFRVWSHHFSREKSAQSYSSQWVELISDFYQTAISWDISSLFPPLWFFNPNWHEGGYCYLLVLFGSDFVSWILIKKFKTFLEVKIDINLVNLTPCQAHWVL